MKAISEINPNQKSDVDIKNMLIRSRDLVTDAEEQVCKNIKSMLFCNLWGLNYSGDTVS